MPAAAAQPGSSAADLRCRPPYPEECVSLPGNRTPRRTCCPPASALGPPSVVSARPCPFSAAPAGPHLTVVFGMHRGYVQARGLHYGILPPRPRGRPSAAGRACRGGSRRIGAGHITLRPLFVGCVTVAQRLQGQMSLDVGVRRIALDDRPQPLACQSGAAVVLEQRLIVR